MAIHSVKDLEAKPDATKLPGRVSLTTTLASTAGPETVDVLYLLDGAHDVWFERADRGLAKSLRFESTIDPGGTLLEHVVTLVEGPGPGPTALVQVDQTVTTASGIPLMSAVVVRILS